MDITRQQNANDVQNDVQKHQIGQNVVGLRPELSAASAAVTMLALPTLFVFVIKIFSSAALMVGKSSNPFAPKPRLDSIKGESSFTFVILDV